MLDASGGDIFAERMTKQVWPELGAFLRGDPAPLDPLHFLFCVVSPMRYR
ncbi:MAG: hypothetical protein JWS10_2003 [Cypionkella sp.]|nr:hypothetical protein [Cypionkella sp.]MDB5664161.1 hypothetical protein [Cypionkella sp.]